MAHWLHSLDQNGVTPLDRALRSGHMALAETMLRQEKYDQQDTLTGATPLHRAACLGLAEAIRSLLAYGAQANARDFHEELALHKAVRAGDLASVRILAEHSDINAAGSTGFTALHWAALAGRADIAQVLLARGADPHQANEWMDGLSAVKIAEIMGYAELARTLSQIALCA